MVERKKIERKTTKEEGTTVKEETEPTPIEKIRGVKEATGERLRKAGYNTIAKIAQAQPNKLAEKSGLTKYLAGRLISSAKEAYKELSTEEISEEVPEEKEKVAEEGQTVKERIVSEAMKDEGFRRRVIHYIVDDLF